MRPKRILIVEDESLIAYDLAGSLEHLGYEVAGIATSGEDAIRMVEEDRPDLILMDIILDGEMDGIETAREIHNRHNIPVIYLTANADEATVTRARDTAPHAYITKPTNERELFSNIDTALYKHHVDEKLRKTKEKYQSLVEEINDLVFEVDENGLLTFANPVVENMSGYRLSEFIGRSFFDFIHKDDLPMVMERYQKLKTGFGTPGEFRIITRSGATKWVRSSSRPILVNGVYRGLRGVIHDITDRKRAEEALLRTKKQLQDILQFLPDATFVVDTAGRVIMWNRAIEHMTGVKQEEIIGKGNYEYSIPFYGERRPLLIDIVLADPSNVEKKYNFVHRRGGAVFAEVYTPVLYGGKGAYLWGTASVLYDEWGAVWGAIESIRDITAIKQMEATIRESEERFFRAFQNSPVGMSIVSIDDDRLVEANDVFLSMLGRSAADAIGRTSLELGMWADPKQRESLMAELHASGAISRRVVGLRDSNGRTLRTLLSIKSVFVGTTGYVLLYSMNVDEHMELFRSLAT